jgi:hypothetical protein
MISSLKVSFGQEQRTFLQGRGSSVPDPEPTLQVDARLQDYLDETPNKLQDTYEMMPLLISI